MYVRQCQRALRLATLGNLAARHLHASAGYRVRLVGQALNRQQLFGNAYQQQIVRYAATDRSKVEYTLKMLKEDLQQQQAENEKKLKLVKANTEPVVKLTIGQKVMHELKHYYHGFRLLALETRLSAKYMWRIACGKTLTRRERQQLVRTVSDLFRLVPFSIFIIVPFMELALPIFIKLFPNMLPSTFQESSKEEERLRKQVKVKVEMAKFLQDTIEEIALEKRKGGKKDGEAAEKESKALDFARFIRKVRSEGGYGYVSNEELFKFSKLFEDELTLDNLSMSQLRSLCKLMLIQPLGTPEILRFQLNLKLRELKADDLQIAAEGGVDALSTSDLQNACRTRGMRALGLSEDRLKQQLSQWLELSLNDEVPPSLLLLSRTLYLPEEVAFTDRLKSLVSNLPEGIAEQTRQKLTEMEGGQVDHKARMELIRKIEDDLKAEKELARQKEAEAKKQAQAKLDAEAAAAAAAEAEAAKATAETAATTASIDATAEKATHVAEKSVEGAGGLAAAAEEKAVQELKAAAEKAKKEVEAAKEELAAVVEEVKAAATKKDKDAAAKAEELKVNMKDLGSIESMLHGSPISEAKHDIIGLKEKVIEHTEDLIEIGALDGAFSESKVARRLRSKLNSMIENVDSLVTRLEDAKRNEKETLADPALEGGADDDKEKRATVKREKLVRIDDLIAQLRSVKSAAADATGEELEKKEEEMERIVALLTALDSDTDGIIDADLVLEAISLLEKHSDVPISPSQMTAMIAMLQKEDQAEAIAKAVDAAKALDQPILPQMRRELPSGEEPVDEEEEKEVGRDGRGGGGGGAQKRVENGPLDVPDVKPPMTAKLDRNGNGGGGEAGKRPPTGTQ